MRTFEERKAEIFCRSEKRIRARKIKRRRILSVAIPLIICVSALGVLLKPTDKSAKTGSTASSDSLSYSNSAAGIFVYSNINVEAYNGEVKNYTADTDGDRLEEISYTLNSVFYEDDAMEDECSGFDGSPASVTDNKMEENTTAKGEAQNTAEEYEIEAIDSNGTRFVYTLSGNSLTNSQTGDTITLTDTELDELLEDLGFKEGG